MENVCQTSSDENDKSSGAIVGKVVASDADRWLAAIVESLDDAIVSKTLDGIIISWNRAAERLFGYSAEEVIGKHIQILLPPELAQEEYVILEKIRRGERLVHYESERVRKDGSRIHLSLTISPIRNESGEIIGASKCARDITDRKRADEALRQELEKLQLITDVMSAPVTRISRDLRYLWVSQPYADWLGLSPDEIIGRLIADVIGQAAFERIRPHIERVLSGEVVKYEEQVNFKGIGPRWINAVYTPIFDSTGQPDGWVAVVIDIDDRKKAEEALREADRRKDEFLAMLAHELRNPLAPIRNAVHVLKRLGPPEPQLQQLRDMIDRQSEHLARLVDDLLEVARFTQGKIELRKEKAEILAMVGRAVEASRSLIEARRQQLMVSLPEEPLRVEGDVVRLGQVIMNLLNNAAKYTGEGGQIWLKVERQDGEVLLRVKDTGMGIPAKDLPYIFDLFAQAERSLDRAQGGLGIGLTLVRRIVEMHGGRVEAFSEGPNRGSEFIVHLPLLAGATPEPQRSVPQRPNEGAEEVLCRVLVVDDNVDSAESMALLLELEGNVVEVAYDGPTAVEAARRMSPHVVLLDIGLPGMNGYEVARVLRQDPRLDKTVLIALTGYGKAEDRTRTKAAGFDHHLTKPVDQEMLASLIKSYIFE
jgi:two-component system CheB/CheR fusion protein